MSVVIRSATINDVQIIHQYIKDLAEFEKADLWADIQDSFSAAGIN